MSRLPKYKYCFVPSCSNTTVTAPNKLFISVPSKEPRRTQWINILRKGIVRGPVSQKSKFFVCEDHFDIENDVENLMWARLFTELRRKVVIRLKPGVVPSRLGYQTTSLLMNERSHSISESLESDHVLKQLIDHSSGATRPCLTRALENKLSDDIRLPLTPRPIYGLTRDIGTQAAPFYRDMAIQSRVHFRSVAVQAGVRKRRPCALPSKNCYHEKCPEPKIHKKR